MSIKLRLKSLFSDRSGQFSIVLAVALPAIVGCVGLATDISEQQRVKFDLQNAVDAGILAAADLATQGASETDVKARIRAYFLASCPVVNCASTVTQTTTILTDKVRVEARATVKTAFMGVFGQSSIAADAKAEMTIKSVPVFYEVHMVLDNTGSMNIIDGLANIQSFRTKFKPWGSVCAFACHNVVSSGKQDKNGNDIMMTKTGAQLARETNTPMREDRLRAEMISQAQSLLSTANASRIKIATYDFNWWVSQRIAPSTNFAQVKKSIDDMAWSSEGTQHAYMADELVRLVGSSGTGLVATSPKKAIVMITDGVSNDWNGSGISTIPASACNKWKAEGRELFILNMVYPDPLEIGDQWYSHRSTMISLVPTIEPALQACASPGKYFRAEYGTSVITALESVKNAILKDAKSMYLAY